jgi:hypothetical protein
MGQQGKAPKTYYFIAAEWIEFPEPPRVITGAPQRPAQPMVMRRNFIIEEHPALHYGRMVSQNPTYFVSMSIICPPDVVSMLERAGMVGNNASQNGAAPGEPTGKMEPEPAAEAAPESAPQPERYVLRRPEGYFKHSLATDWSYSSLEEAERFDTPAEARRAADDTRQDWETVPLSQAA